MALIPIVDPNDCLAHRNCEEVAPGVFRVDDEVAIVIGTAPDEEIIAAAEVCPASAIRVIDEATQEQVFP